MTEEDSNLPFKRGQYPALPLFGFTFLNVFIVVFHFRAVAEDDWAWTLVGDLIYGLLGFTLFKKMQEAKTKTEMLAYTLGCVFGSQAALWAYKLYSGAWS